MGTLTVKIDRTSLLEQAYVEVSTKDKVIESEQMGEVELKALSALVLCMYQLKNQEIVGGICK